MPPSSSRLLNSADLPQRRVVGAGGERGADLAGDDAEPGDGRGLPVGVVQRRARPGGRARVPAGVPQREEEPGHDQRGGDEAEEAPGPGQHRPR